MMMHTVKFTDLNVETQLPDQSKLVDLAEMVEDAIPFSCMSGICGSCVIEVEQGAENLSPAEPLERTFLDSLGFSGDEFRLACQCKLFGSISINSAP